jgi:nucleoid DNA-binding protein
MKKVIEQLMKSNQDLSKVAIEAIVDSQFKFVRETMKQGEFKSVRLRYLGIFGVKQGRLNYINENMRKSEQNRATKTD